MADSALSVDLFVLREDVQHYLGKGRDWGTLDDGDRRLVDAHIASGLRTFYRSHKWSFLRPWRELQLPVGTWRLDLPDDFGSVSGSVVCWNGLRSWELDLVGSTEVVRNGDVKGRVSRYAVAPKEMPLSEGQRFELMVSRCPDEAVTLRLRYNVIPRTITSSAPYPYGGMQHGETIREACLASAESDSDDSLGIHRQLYERNLLDSKRIDADTAPDNLGYNGDGRAVFPHRREMNLFVNGRRISGG